MLEVDVPTIDPLQAESRVFLGLSLRQIVCVVPAVIVGGVAFWKLKDTSLDLAILALAVVIAPAVCFGWLKPYQMRFEQFLDIFWKNRFVNPPKRIYHTDNSMNELYKNEQRSQKSFSELLKEGMDESSSKKKKKESKPKQQQEKPPAEKPEKQKKKKEGKK